MRKLMLALVCVMALSISAINAQDGLVGTVLTLINVRVAPDGEGAKIGELNVGQEVIVEGRNRVGNWVLVRPTDGGVRGWVASRYMAWDRSIELASLAVLDEVIGGAPTTTLDTPTENSVPIVVESGNSGTATTTLNVRSGASRSNMALSQVPSGTAFTVEARNDVGDWLLVNTGTVRGWVATGYVRTSIEVNGLPVSSEIVGQTAATVTNNVGGVPLTEGDAAIVALLDSIPVIYNVGSNAAAIYQRGVASGRNSNYFMKIGDSNSESLGYLGLFGVGSYNLGAYRDLQTTVDFFKSSGNSWLEVSQVAQSGNLTTTIIDPIFTDLDNCYQGEAPLTCEIRVQNPSIALIYLGAADNQLLDTGSYGAALRQIVNELVSQNVLPILTTMPTRPHPVRPQSYGLSFNAVIVQVAQEYNIPLLNMWKATQGMPDNGMQGDLLHFTITPNYRFVDLRGDENMVGYSAWNLGALQMMDAIRRTVAG